MLVCLTGENSLQESQRSVGLSLVEKFVEVTSPKKKPFFFKVACGRLASGCGRVVGGWRAAAARIFGCGWRAAAAGFLEAAGGRLAASQIKRWAAGGRTNPAAEKH